MSVLKKFLGVLSGGNTLKVSEQLLFDKVIGFRGIVPGVGTSTIVQNVAIALSENTNCTVCVLDMNCLYPTQYPMLLSNDEMISNSGKSKKDLFDFNGDVSDIVYTTSYKNVFVTGFWDRTVVDMLSAKDSDATFNQVLGGLKSFFDIILVDLSYELTTMNTQAGIKCNKIINVADQSLKCVVNLRKSLNTSATLAVPFAKANTVVLNKVAPDLNTDTVGLLKSVNLDIIGQIGFNMDIFKLGVNGGRIYYKNRTNTSLQEFNDVIDEILKLIINPTPLTNEFFKEKDGTDNINDDTNILVEDIEEEIIETFVKKEDNTTDEDEIDL